MSDIILVENFLPKGYARDIKNMFLDGGMDWYYSEKSVTRHENLNPEKYFIASLFSHVFLRDGERLCDRWRFIAPIQYLIEDLIDEEIFISRCKANLTLNLIHDCSKVEVPHIDNNPASKYVAIYYPITSDGNTVIYKQRVGDSFIDYEIETEVCPQENSFVIFSGDRYHSSNIPCEYTKRFSLNFVIHESQNG